MKLGFTGTRHGMTPHQRRSFARYLKHHEPLFMELHHGDCRGADMDACCIFIVDVHRYWDSDFERTSVVVHPPDYDGHRAFCMEECEDYGVYCVIEPPKPFLERNRDIVDSCDLLVACPAEFEEQQRGGTWSTVRYARKVGRELVIIWPDGSTT